MFTKKLRYHTERAYNIVVNQVVPWTVAGIGLVSGAIVGFELGTPLGAVPCALFTAGFGLGLARLSAYGWDSFVAPHINRNDVQEVLARELNIVESVREYMPSCAFTHTDAYEKAEQFADEVSAAGIRLTPNQIAMLARTPEKMEFASRIAEHFVKHGPQTAHALRADYFNDPELVALTRNKAHYFELERLLAAKAIRTMPLPHHPGRLGRTESREAILQAYFDDVAKTQQDYLSPAQLAATHRTVPQLHEVGRRATPAEQHDLPHPEQQEGLQPPRRLN